MGKIEREYSIEEASAITGLSVAELKKLVDDSFGRRWRKELDSMDQNSDFVRVSKIEDISKLSWQERERYEYAIKSYRDAYAVEYYQWQKGYLSGFVEGFLETVLGKTENKEKSQKGGNDE